MIYTYIDDGGMNIALAHCPPLWPHTPTSIFNQRNQVSVFAGVDELRVYRLLMLAFELVRLRLAPDLRRPARTGPDGA